MKNNWIAYSLGLFIVMTQAVFAVDSTAVVAPTGLKPSAANSYQLYQGDLILVGNTKYIGSQTIKVSNLMCSPGYAGCIRAFPVNSSNLNAQACGWYQFYSQVSLVRDDSIKGYQVTYLFAYSMKGNGSSCSDRGGVFTYVIDCIPMATVNLSPDLLTSHLCSA